MRNALLFAALVGAFGLGACSSVPVITTASRQPDINLPGGHPPVAAAEVRLVEYRVGVAEVPDPAGCSRIGAVYGNWGLDWIDFTPHVRPEAPVLLAALRERAGAIGANAIAWPGPDTAVLNYVFVYRCPPA